MIITDNIKWIFIFYTKKNEKSIENVICFDICDEKEWVS